MLVLKERIINVPVVSIQTGGQIAYTTQPIIDPRQLIVVGFYCDGPALDVKPAILLVDDIRETDKMGYIVNSADNLVQPDDLVRLKAVLSYNFTLDNKQVVDDLGHKVGKVVNYTLDTKSFYITQLHVQPNLLRSWSVAEVVIGRTQIIEVTDTKIVVASPTIRKEKPAVAAKSVVENPFRHASPQTEVSHSASERG